MPEVPAAPAAPAVPEPFVFSPIPPTFRPPRDFTEADIIFKQKKCSNAPIAPLSADLMLIRDPDHKPAGRRIPLRLYTISYHGIPLIQYLDDGWIVIRWASDVPMPTSIFNQLIKPLFAPEHYDLAAPTAAPAPNTLLPNSIFVNRKGETTRVGFVDGHLVFNPVLRLFNVV